MTELATDEQIAALQALYETALPGEWAYGVDEHNPGLLVAGRDEDGAYLYVWAEEETEGPWIAASHNLWPAILARLQTADSLVQRACVLLTEVDDDTEGPGQGEMWSDAYGEWLGDYEKVYGLYAEGDHGVTAHRWDARARCLHCVRPELHGPEWVAQNLGDPAMRRGASDAD